jgi:hypothetical protein
MQLPRIGISSHVASPQSCCGNVSLMRPFTMRTSQSFVTKECWYDLVVTSLLDPINASLESPTRYSARNRRRQTTVSPNMLCETYWTFSGLQCRTSSSTTNCRSACQRLSILILAGTLTVSRLCNNSCKSKSTARWLLHPALFKFLVELEAIATEANVEQQLAPATRASSRVQWKVNNDDLGR